MYLRARARYANNLGRAIRCFTEGLQSVPARAIESEAMSPSRREMLTFGGLSGGAMSIPLNFWGYDGSHPGPTFELQCRESVVRHANQLPSTHPTLRYTPFTSGHGDVILVNGRAWPVLKVERRTYRFRILDARPSAPVTRCSSTSSTAAGARRRSATPSSCGIGSVARWSSSASWPSGAGRSASRTVSSSWTPPCGTSDRSTSHESTRPTSVDGAPGCPVLAGRQRSRVDRLAHPYGAVPVDDLVGRVVPTS